MTTSLIDRSKRNPAIIDSAKILDLKTDDWYWTRTSFAGDSGDVWFVDLKDGNVNYCYKDGSNYVRPVRSSMIGNIIQDNNLLDM